MKDVVLNGLLTARSLFDAARVHCFVRDRHVASGGLVILQDAFEMVLYCCLLELGVDEQKKIDQLTFDQLLGELRAVSFAVTKSGTLAAMNKQRVVVKHHAQLAEPEAVSNYYRIALEAADDLLRRVVGKALRDIVVADGVVKPELKEQILDATNAIAARQYLDAMKSIRKALFLAYEKDYDLRFWEVEGENGKNMFTFMLRFSSKVPEFARDAAWIKRYVKRPTDYVYLDNSRARSEMLEIGVDPEEFFNVVSLTPPVHYDRERDWSFTIGPEHVSAANEENARYCLDVLVSIVRNQQLRANIIRRSSGQGYWTASILRDEPLREYALGTSAAVAVLEQGSVWEIQAIVSGLDGVEYLHLARMKRKAGVVVSEGYVVREACKIE